MRVGHGRHVCLGLLDCAGWLLLVGRVGLVGPASRGCGVVLDVVLVVGLAWGGGFDCAFGVCEEMQGRSRKLV